MTNQSDVRKRWMAVLARCSVEVLERAVERWNAHGRWRRVRAPQTGLIMVRSRIGGTGDVFNLGEMAVTRCTVQLTNGCMGHAYVKGRDQRHAELAAVLDALLQDENLHEELLAGLIAPQAAVQTQAKEMRSRQAAATRVDFYTMNRGAA